MNPLLEVIDIKHSFGGLTALDKVAFSLHPGRIKAVIGPNGAGKTTLFNITTGMISADEGQIIFDGKRIDNLKPHQIAQVGIARTFQNLSLFYSMSVLENVMLGRHTKLKPGIIAEALNLPMKTRRERVTADEAMRRLEFCNIADEAGNQASALPFGKRRMLELARALALEPKLLLLDEPASGLNTGETDALAKLIAKIRDSGVTILLVEHDMSLVMDISDDILVLNFGIPVAEGTPAAIRNNREVIDIYLGGDFASAQD